MLGNVSGRRGYGYVYRAQKFLRALVRRNPYSDGVESAGCHGTDHSLTLINHCQRTGQKRFAEFIHVVVFHADEFINVVIFMHVYYKRIIRRATFRLENLFNRLVAVRYRAQTVHRFRRKTYQLAAEYILFGKV